MLRQRTSRALAFEQLTHTDVKVPPMLAVRRHIVTDSVTAKALHRNSAYRTRFGLGLELDYRTLRKRLD